MQKTFSPVTKECVPDNVAHLVFFSEKTGIYLALFAKMFNRIFKKIAEFIEFVVNTNGSSNRFVLQTETNKNYG